jgi:hypothetical protein
MEVEEGTLWIVWCLFIWLVTRRTLVEVGTSRCLGG